MKWGFQYPDDDISYLTFIKDFEHLDAGKLTSRLKRRSRRLNFLWADFENPMNINAGDPRKRGIGFFPRVRVSRVEIKLSRVGRRAKMESRANFARGQFVARRRVNLALFEREFGTIGSRIVSRSLRGLSGLTDFFDLSWEMLMGERGK